MVALKVCFSRLSMLYQIFLMIDWFVVGKKGLTDVHDIITIMLNLVVALTICLTFHTKWTRKKIMSNKTFQKDQKEQMKSSSWRKTEIGKEYLKERRSLHSFNQVIQRNLLCSGNRLPKQNGIVWMLSLKSGIIAKPQTPVSFVRHSISSLVYTYS